jgi:hypothetical protein
MFYIAVSKGYDMFRRMDPSISSVEGAMLYEDIGRIKFVDTSKTLFEVTEDNPDNTILLD